MATINLVGTCHNVGNCLFRGMVGTTFFLKEDNGLTYYVRVRAKDMQMSKPNEGTRVSVWCNRIEKIIGQFCVDAELVVKP